MGQSQNNSAAGTPGSFERTSELTWAMLDDCINGQEFAELEDLLLNDKTARDSYLNCIQLHAELAKHFAGSATGTAPTRPTKTPILGFLGTDSGPITGLNTPKT